MIYSHLRILTFLINDVCCCCCFPDSSWRSSHSVCCYSSTSSATLSTSLLSYCWWRCWVSLLCAVKLRLYSVTTRWNLPNTTLCRKRLPSRLSLSGNRLHHGHYSEGSFRHVGAHPGRHHAARQPHLHRHVRLHGGGGRLPGQVRREHTPLRKCF